MKRMICVAALVLALCRIALPASAVELDVAGESGADGRCHRNHSV